MSFFRVLTPVEISSEKIDNLYLRHSNGYRDEISRVLGRGSALWSKSQQGQGGLLLML